MTIPAVPASATWLLSQFVSGKRRESLLGDLFEEYQAGHLGWHCFLLDEPTCLLILPGRL